MDGRTSPPALASGDRRRSRVLLTICAVCLAVVLACLAAVLFAGSGDASAGAGTSSTRQLAAAQLAGARTWAALGIADAYGQIGVTTQDPAPRADDGLTGCPVDDPDATCVLSEEIRVPTTAVASADDMLLLPAQLAVALGANGFAPGLPDNLPECTAGSPWHADNVGLCLQTGSSGATGTLLLAYDPQ